MRSSRVVVITLDSAISDAQFENLLREWEDVVEEAACTYAAAEDDDTYEVMMYAGRLLGG